MNIHINDTISITYQKKIKVETSAEQSSREDCSCSICADNINIGEKIICPLGDANCMKHPFHLGCYEEYVQKRNNNVVCPICGI
ncbi:MAG TPA: RING finger domain-containing protein [Nitrosarchaeum sp.]|nr:RING finger domain-containing protein [Nitrosarchaeum sp.]